MLKDGIEVATRVGVISSVRKSEEYRSALESLKPFVKGVLRFGTESDRADFEELCREYLRVYRGRKSIGPTQKELKKP